MRADGLREVWDSLWHRLGAAGDPGPVYQDLLSRYAESGRAYHTIDHVTHCLAELHAIRDRLMDSDAVEFALWFHDAVYETRRHDNEERSSAIACEAARRASLSEPFRELVDRLIVTTKHAECPGIVDGQYLVDIDLAILGQSRQRFDQYDRQIRAEYDWVPDDIFAQGRAAILSSFLNRPRIYFTEFFHRQYEEAARANLSRGLKRLARDQ